MTRHASRHPLYQTSVARFAREPIVDVGFDQYVTSDVLPEGEIHCVILGFRQRDGSGYVNVSFFLNLPVWSRGDSVGSAFKVGIVSEVITPD